MWRNRSIFSDIDKSRDLCFEHFFVKYSSLTTPVPAHYTYTYTPPNHTPAPPTLPLLLLHPQRKLVKECDESVCLALACHVNECLLYPENASYISRSSEVGRLDSLEKL